MSRKRGKRRSRKTRRNIVILVLVLLIVIPSLTWFLAYGLTNKPLIDYTFGQTSDIRQSYFLIAMTQTRPGTIDILNVLVRNRGPTDASVIITVHAQNALISASYSGPYNDMASTLILALANGKYRYVTFYLTLLKQVPSFTIWCDVTKIIDYSTVSSFAATILSDIKPITPILLEYREDSSNPDSYQLVQT